MYVHKNRKTVLWTPTKVGPLEVMQVGKDYSQCQTGRAVYFSLNVCILHAFVFNLLNIFHVAGAVTALNDGNFFDAISTCLDTHPVDGLCYSSKYGAMPDWDTSQITNMTGCQNRYYYFDMILGISLAFKIHKKEREKI